MVTSEVDTDGGVDLEARFRELEQRYRTVGRIVSALNADLPVEEIVREVGTALQKMIPCDRFSLGLPLLDKWYFLEEGGLRSGDFYSQAPLTETYSASRWVILNRQPLLRRDISKEQRFESDALRLKEGMLSDLIVPLVVEEETIGTFNFTAREPDRYDEVDLEVGKSVAGAVASAIKQLQTRRDVEAIREISEAVQQSLDLDAVLEMIMEHIRSQGYDRVRVFLCDEEGKALVGAVQVGFARFAEFEGMRLPIAEDAYSRRTFERKRAQVYRTGELGPGGAGGVLERLSEGVVRREWAELPLMVEAGERERIVGKITLDTVVSERPLMQARVDRLMVYASQAAIAIRNAQLHREVVRQAEGLEAEVEERTAALQEREAQLKMALKAARMGVFDSNPVTGELVWSESVESLFGFEPGTFPGTRDAFYERVHPEDREAVRRAASKAIEAGAEFDVEHRIVRADGAVRWMASRGHAIRDEAGGSVRLVGTVMDITGRKQAEEALHRSRERYSLATDAARVGVWDWNIQTGAFYLDPNIKAILGYTDGEIPNDLEVWVQYVHPDDREAVMAAAAEHLEGRAPAYVFEHRMLHKDGSERWIMVRGKVVRDAEGKAVRMVGTDTDITERKQAEEARRESEERFRTIFEQTSAGMAIASPEGRLLQVNAAFSRFLGYAESELLEMTIDNVTHPDDREKTGRYLDALVAGRSQGMAGLEKRYVRKDGATVWGYVSVVWMRDLDSRPLYGVALIQDITEQKRSEQELVRLERLHALGEMAAGVSHNLNNILATILGPAQLLKRGTDDPKLLREAEDIIRSTKRASDLVHRLNRAVQGDTGYTLQPVSIAHLVREAVRETRPWWKDEAEAQGIAIDIVTDLEDVPNIRGTQDGLHDILINLLFNAVDAMPGGGTITIEAQAAREEVRLAVSDSGIGMDEETRRRVFEPFFTTKADVGTGLGLSTVYGTVARWGGHIEVESAPGKGTTFTLRLPPWTEPGIEKSEDTAVRPARRGRVLVVEDEDNMRFLLQRVLEADHEVELAAGGREALERFTPGRYDAALIDLGMPEMPGDRVAQAMREVDASISTVLVTGWELEADDPRLSVFDLQIHKPFGDIDALRSVVARAVELRDARAERQDHERARRSKKGDETPQPHSRKTED